MTGTHQHSMDPTSREVFGEYRTHSIAECLEILEKANSTQQNWKTSTFDQRAQCLLRCASILKDRKDNYARLITREMGKLFSEAQSEIEKCALLCEYYAEYGAEILSPIHRKSELEKSYICFNPLGIILAVMPWNFPFWQVLRCAAPALFAGNGVILKHAANVPACSKALEELFLECGFPDGLFHSLMIPRETVNDLITHPFVRGITLTGSESAGRAVAESSGRALKKTVLELGGSDPYLILDDVSDLESAVETCVKSRLICNGQSCIAAKRFIVTAGIKDRFQDALIARMSRIQMGNPLEEATRLGPLARHDLREKLHEQVSSSISMGANVLCGAEVRDDDGFYYPATVITDVSPGMSAFDEELFGPVAPIIEAKDEEQAVQLANRTSFGLGAAVFTSDLERGEYIARDLLSAGTCCVNTFVRSDPRFPFGGIKNSGYGRELSEFGIREFVNIKTLMVSS